MERIKKGRERNKVNETKGMVMKGREGKSRERKLREGKEDDEGMGRKGKKR